MPTRIAASQAPIHKECIESVRSVTPSGCARRFIDSCPATEQEDTSTAAPDAMATSVMERARLGSCRLKTEPLSQHDGQAERYYWGTGCQRVGRPVVSRV